MIKQYICSSIRNKLLMITGLGAALIIGAASYGIYVGGSVEQKMFQMMYKEIAFEADLRSVSSSFESQVQNWKNVLIRGHDVDQREKYWARFSAEHQSVQTGIVKLMQDAHDEALSNKLEEFKQAHALLLAQYTAGMAKFVDSSFNHVSADIEVKGIDKAPTELLREVSVMMGEAMKRNVVVERDRAGKSIKLTIVMITGAVIVSAIIFLLMIQRIIVTPAKSVAHDLSLMAKGDFNHEIIATSNDEIGQVANSAAKLRDDIGGIVEGINQSVFKLSTSSEEMAHNTDQLNQLMIQQRSETDQVATAMNQMTATVHEVAQNAQLASDSANQANGEVNTGQGVVNDAINAISKLVQQVETAADVIQVLENDSIEIGSVLDVIRSIAEQTNLLALNAAIEAARAGEQGRGFAVVADEVRVLAQRTQTSTQEIQDMIEKVQGGAQQAVEAMNQSRSQADVTRDTAAKAGEVLTRITRSVTNINDMNTLIASSAEEQNAVAEEINRSIVSISQGAESVSESATQTATTSDELRNVAEELKHVVSGLSA
ncbi:Methyl-accepting chemotaxis sensor/transducer protein [hydrothermal vent metagenome]|uniref:Methyl-accepting chemotaxis sensor/transducer protein n=1 Tax=hydrothermal vent metagenome TaxID=652676 RepID=A0A3B0XFF3_9ZZZZ